MKILVAIEVDEQVYRQAIADGWHHRYNEYLAGDDVRNMTLDDPADFQMAADFMPIECFKWVTASDY